MERLGIGGEERRTPIIEALRIAGDVAAALAALPTVERADVMGSLRRFRETIGDIDVVVTSRGDAEEIMQRFVELPVVRDVVAYGARKTAIIGAAGMQVDVRVVRPDQYGAAALYFTGSAAHNVRLRQLAIERGWTLNEYALSDAATGAVIASETEEQIYEALGLSSIPPEIREDDGEIELASAGDLPRLVEEHDLRGDLHVHTDLSGDGREALEDMVAAAAARGYGYVAITDHGEDLAINGASRSQMLEQRRRIEGLRTAFPRLVILHGCELNIGPDGNIDYDPDFLDGFDWGIAGVHSHFDLDRTEQTARLITAMENPAVNAIGHLTGRRIGMRPGIDLEVDAVLDAAEATGCALEINSHLDRLDAPGDVLRTAATRDVVLLVDTDAHDSAELANVRWGVRHARRAWVTPERVANTWPPERFLAWAAAKRSR
jgi:DNA polymerase (family 10)